MHDEEQRWKRVLTRSNSSNCSSKGQTFYLVCCEKFMNSLLNAQSFSVTFTSDLETVWHGHVQLFFSPLLFCTSGYVVLPDLLIERADSYIKKKNRRFAIRKVKKEFETYNY